MKKAPIFDGTENDFSIYIEGDELEPNEALGLEQKVIEFPDSMDIRLKLLCYYSRTNVDNASLWFPHACWLVRNRPRDWVTGNLRWPASLTKNQIEDLSQLWLDVAETSGFEPMVLGRAGTGLMYYDPVSSKRFLKQAIDLEPQNVVWLRAISRLYMLIAESDSSHNCSDFISSAFDYSDVTLSIDHHAGERNGLLTLLCEFALAMRTPEKASKYSSMILEEALTEGLPHRIFQAYCFAGRSKLISDEVEGAKLSLLKASGYGFFPSLQLASELVSAGEEDIVCEFLERCLDSAGEYAPRVRQLLYGLRNGEKPKLVL